MSDAATPATTAPRRRWRLIPKSRRGWCMAILISLALILLFAYILARLTPSWYRPLDPNSLQVIDTLAIGQDKIGPDLHNSLQRVPLGDQRWTISQVEINSVLAYRFAVPAGTDGSHPYPVLSAPFVMFTPGKITIAARTTKVPGPAPAGGVASVRFSVDAIASTPPDPPRGVVKIDGAWLGDLPIPKSLVEGKVRAHVPEIVAALNQASVLALRDPAKLLPQLDAAIHAIEYGEPFPLRFTYDRRVVIVKEIRIDDGSLTLIFGPETPAAVRPRPVASPLSNAPLVPPNR